MKYLEDKYPKGTFPYQKTAGKYVNSELYANFEIMAKNISRDMTFLIFIYSSTLEVGTGKSVFASQLGELWTHLVNNIHGLHVPFDVKNCVFKPEDLIKRSFEVPRYSYVWLDEWEETHYWSKLGMTLRTFFRKCRQLNLMIVCIIPNFFQLPISYAVSRSVAAIDVRFENEFERGFFYFYNFAKKKELYIKGKKTQNYFASQPNFQGRFTDGYAVNEKEYRALKHKDMIENEGSMNSRDRRKDYILRTHKKFPEIKVKDLAELSDVSEQSIYNWINGVEKEGVSA